MMVEVEWLESLVIGPLLQMVVLCGYILTNGKWFHTYFIWNFWSTVGPPFGQNKSNSFEIHLNNSQLSLFIQARPTPFLSWVGPRAARPSLPAPLPLPAGPRSSVDQRCLTVRTRRTALVRRGRAAAGRCHVATLSPGVPRAPSSFSVPALHVAPSRTHPSPASPPPLQKAARRRRAHLSFSLPRSPPHTAKRAASCPRRRPSHRGPPQCISDCRRHRPPHLHGQTHPSTAIF
jgi:hypothetical protein